MKRFKDIFIGLLCGVLFIILIFWYEINIITSIFITISIFSVINLILYRKSSLEIFDSKYDGQEAIHNFVKDNEIKIGVIRNNFVNLDDNIKLKLEVICNIAEDILINIVNNPQNIEFVKKVFNYYLGAVNKVISTYKQLSLQDINSKEAEIRSKKFENILDELIIIFNKYREVSIERQLLHLDNELILLEKLIKTEV